MQTRRVWNYGAVFGLAALVCVAAATRSDAARQAKTETPAGAEATEGDLEARRLYDKAQELLQANETERGVKMLESVVEQYPKSGVSLEAYLALGKHYLAAHEQLKAISYLNRLRSLEKPDEELQGALREMVIESLYLTGVAYFQIRQYGQAFPLLRKITNNYPNTVWANQAYYYIGMCHFAQQNWNKTIDSLSLVGTFVDPDSPTIQYVEAGRRFYVKVQDGDLPVLVSLGKPVTVSLETPHGDRETVGCIPLAAESGFFIGSIPTEIGTVKTNDNALQVIGSDRITVRYVDESSQDGQTNVVRESLVRVVSSGALNFTSGDYETECAAAFLDQPICLLLHDVDLDTTDGADAAEIKIIARYKETDDTEDTGRVMDVRKLLAGDEQRYAVRDQVTLRLAELGDAPVHSGRFGAKLPLESAKGDKPVDQTDGVLICALDDELVATYGDDLGIDGEVRRTVDARISVLGAIDNRPKATQDVVFDAVVKAKKNLVEATAYLELARIFRSMGLLAGAKEKGKDGLDRVEFVVRTQVPIPSELKQEAFKLKWELHIVGDDFQSAMGTCQLFNRLYPDSPFVDEALMGIASIRLENKEYHEAIQVLQQVLALPRSERKAEAQFRIAEATEVNTKAGSEAAVQQYKQCAERYPESPFAGASLAKLVDYHIEQKDYNQANTVLEQVFQDYPDASFLDSMLLKWVLVAYRAGDFERAYEKCSQLLFEYPESPYAEKARQIMPKIEPKLKKAKEQTGVQS